MVGLSRHVEKVKREIFFCDFNFLLLLACPKGRSIYNQTSDDANKILTDNCSEEDGDEWLAPEGAFNEDAEIIIDMGCATKVHGIQMKNVKMEDGGTKQFTVFQSTSPSGPWDAILSDELKPADNSDCAVMQTFNTE